MLRLALEVYLTLGLVNSSSNAFLRNYSSKSIKFIDSLNPIQIYSSLHQASKRKAMLQDLTEQGGVILFLNKNTYLYAIEGSPKLANYLNTLFNKEYLKYLASLNKSTKKPKVQLKSHYKELLQQDWKDYDLYWLESWPTSEEINIQERLAYYHTKYQPKLNPVRYVTLANGEIEAVYQWKNFKTKEQILVKSQTQAKLKPLLTYRLDNISPLSKWQGKVYYENKQKIGIYRWVNRITKQSYIGSSLNLGSILYALSKITIKNYQLNQAIQEHGLTNFNLQILVYCTKEKLAEKEQYYLQLFNPEYNITISEENKERSTFFNKDKEETLVIDKLPNSLIKYNTLAKQLVLFKPPKQFLTVSNFSPILSLIVWKVKPIQLLIRDREIPVPVTKVKTKKTWTLSEATRLKQSLAQQKRTKHPKPGFAVQVQDLSNNTTTVYSSIREAARALNIDKQVILHYFNRNQTKPYKGKYTFAKV